MAYRFAVEGTAVECDTAAEAAELIMAVASRRQPSKLVNGHATRDHEKPSESKKKTGFTSLWDSLSKDQREFLTAITDNYPNAIRAEDVATACGVEFKDVGWVRRKIEGLAALSGVDPHAMYSVEREMVEGKPRRAYLAKGLLIEGIKAVAIDSK